MENINKLKEIKASIEIFDKKYRESKGYGECTKPSSAEMEDVMYQMVSSVYKYVDYVQSNFYSWQSYHTDNHTHLPKLTASQTEKLLKAAGASEDFDVAKPTIWARANTNKSKSFEIDLKMK